MRASLLPANPSSISKPCIRKHPSSEKINNDQQDYARCRFDPSSKKAQSRLYSCVIIFFFISSLIFLHSNDNNAPAMPSTHLIHSHSIPVEDEAPVAHRVALEFPTTQSSSSALRGLGTIFRCGNVAMSELVVAHVSEHTLPSDLRVFLRTLHRSGMTAHADVVLLFPWSMLPETIVNVIHEEEDSFQKLLSAMSNVSMLSSIHSNASISSFNIKAFSRGTIAGELRSPAVWGNGKPIVSHANNNGFKWGHIVGFDASELNPDDTLQGFVDHAPLQLRRWECYKMLLGMVRSHFKHVSLIGVQGTLVLGDSLAFERKKVGLYLTLEDRKWAASVDMPQSLMDHNTGQDIADRHHSETPIMASSLPSGVNSVGQNHGTQSVPTQAHRSEMHQTRSTFDPPVRIYSVQPNMTGFGGGRRHLTSQAAPARRRTGGGRRRRKHKPGSGALYEHVYGRRMWSTLDDSERRKKLVNSGAIAGGVQQVRGLANAMVTEIVKVALERKSREPFPDNIVLSYLTHKSSGVLGRKVLDHLHIMENSESFVHSLVGSQQPSLFWRKSRQRYAVIRGNSKHNLWGTVIQGVLNDICFSPIDAQVYRDCLEFV